MSTAKSLYRPEIDGLRALAVVIVVLFHAGFGMPGGYVGVDVFFVISGFLITGIISRELESGRFTLAGFWNRRIRRILPPLLVVILATLAVGYSLLLPKDLHDLARSAVAQVFMSANIFFWQSTDYFETQANEKPLLHMWSLAVEEQFYVVFPVLLVMLYRNQMRVRTILAALTVVSFAWSVYGSYQTPGAAYFLLPARAWELLLGSLLALSNVRLPLSIRAREVSGWCGLLAILASSLLYSKATRFPGVAALLPCLGTVCVIASNSGQLLSSGRLLAWKPIVGVGLISYSLYLWHWPILVFSRYWAIEGLSCKMRGVAVGISLVVAWLSWRFIEAPFRSSSWAQTTPNRKVIASGFACLTSLAGFAVFLLNAPVEQHFPVLALRMADASEDREQVVDCNLQTIKTGELPSMGITRPEIDLLVWGDSHAVAAMPAIRSLCEEKQIHGVAAVHVATAPLVSYVIESPWGLNGDAPSFSEAVIQYVEEKKIPRVVLIGAWYWISGNLDDGKPSDEFRRSLRTTLVRLRGTGADVAIMLQVPSQPWEMMPRYLARETLRGSDLKKLGLPVSRHRERFAAINQAIREAAEGIAEVFDPEPCFLDGDVCVAQRDGYPLYYDHSHLTRHGAMELRPMFRMWLPSQPENVEIVEHVDDGEPSSDTEPVDDEEQANLAERTYDAEPS